jgi:hypothetical protein
LAIDNIGERNITPFILVGKPTDVSGSKRQWEKHLTAPMRFYPRMYFEETFNSH